MNSLLELKDGKTFSTLSLPVVPRTNEDAERILKRGEKTKEVLFHDIFIGGDSDDDDDDIEDSGLLESVVTEI